MAEVSRRKPATRSTTFEPTTTSKVDDRKLNESQIVYLQTDPFRQASIDKRQYEELHPETVDWSKRLPHRSHAEFGGAIGVTSILVFSHCLIWFFTLCLQINKGNLILPQSIADFTSFDYFNRLIPLLIKNSSPTVETCVWYWSFLIIQGVFALTLPGIDRLGEPLPALKGMLCVLLQ